MDVYAQNGVKPVPTLKTDRLTLRTFRADDAPIVIDALNVWDVTKWLTRVPFPYAQADFDWFLAEMCSDPDDVIWAIDLDGEFVGTISAARQLGYWLHPAHHGKGIMSEAGQCACDWHFAQGKDDLISGHHLGNGPSCAVLTKLGFVNRHINYDVETARGDLVDTQRMVLTRARWESLRHA